MLLTATGYTLYATAPRRAFPWILASLAVAYAGQTLGALVFGAQLSGFVGALVAIVAVRLLRRLPASPPEAVMLTCAYWMLVPGSLGFIDLSRALEGSAGVPIMLVHSSCPSGRSRSGWSSGVGVTSGGDGLLRRWSGRPRAASAGSLT